MDPNQITDVSSVILLVAVALSSFWREKTVRIYTILFILAGAGLLVTGLIYDNWGIVRMEVVFILLNLWAFAMTFKKKEVPSDSTTL
jgi:hypothetical protein